MTYTVQITSKARDSLSKLPNDVQEKIAARISALAADPRPTGHRRIKGLPGCYRIRQGDYRIVYAIVDDRLYVYVVRVGHRRQVYERLDTLEGILESLRTKECQ